MVSEIERAADALNQLDAGCARDEWVRAGMAAKSAGLSFDDFHNWSASAGNYTGEKECRTAWKSFDESGAVTSATLYVMAFAQGWKDPSKSRTKGTRPLLLTKTEKVAQKPVKQAASLNAVAVWSRCIPATPAEAYIDRKQGKPDGLRVYPTSASPLIIRGQTVAGYLVVPCWSGVHLQTLQFIPPDDGDKLNLPGASFNDGFFTVGEITDRAYIVEGIGQAWAVHKATGAAAVACFGAGRIMTVAKVLHDKFPSARLVVVPDRGKENKAADIAAAVSGQWVEMPDDKPSNYDVNDFLQEAGSSALAVLLEQTKEPPAKEASFNRISLADVWSNPPEPQRYIWGNRVPFDALTLLAAHGGTGKSLFALQLAAHTSTGTDFLGLPTERSKTLFFSAEDAANTIRRRFGSLCRADGLEPAEVERNLIVLDATDAPCLFHEVSEGGVRRGEVTEHFDELKAMIKAECVRFLIVDNASDTFGANPIDRQAVTQFIRALVRLVRGVGGAVLMLSHVNKNTSKAAKNQTDTESYADSAAWHNAARSRLFLNAVDNQGNLSLGHQKNNVGKKQPLLNIAFRDDGSSLITTNAAHLEQSKGVNASANALIRIEHRAPLLKLIHEFYGRGENISVSPNSPSTNTHSMLKAEAGYPLGLKKPECLAVVRECEREGLLVRETYRKPDRHNGQRWALTPEGLRFIGVDVPVDVAPEVMPVDADAEV